MQGKKKKTTYVITVKPKGKLSTTAIVTTKSLSKIAGPGAAKIINDDKVASVTTIYKNGSFERLDKIEK